MSEAAIGVRTDTEVGSSGGGRSEQREEMIFVMSCLVLEIMPPGCNIRPNGALTVWTEICWVCSGFGDISCLKGLDSNGRLIASSNFPKTSRCIRRT